VSRDPIGPATVPGAFDDHAASYDRLVGRNPGYHEHLRLSARRLTRWSAPEAPPRSATGPRLLDLGCGTGASTAALLAAAPEAEIVAVDGSAEMIAEARRKDWPERVTFVHSRLEDLPATGITGPFDGILAAYLVRNLPDPDPVLRSFRSLLRPGATLAVHEYSVRDSRLASAVWNSVATAIIIPSGRLRTGDASLYRYLRRSVNEFDGAAAFRRRLQDNGFRGVRSETMPGWQRNIVHTFLAEAHR
jgi:ubiquinone/menaquinone biosynthesis C-methylase UbiE